MAFQSIINQFQAPGIPGEFADNSPRTVQPAILNGTDDALPTIGRVFTYTAPTTDPMQVTLGGAAANFAGILVNPKELVRANGLTAGLEVTEDSIGSICREGHIWVKVVFHSGIQHDHGNDFRVYRRIRSVRLCGNPERKIRACEFRRRWHGRP